MGIISKANTESAAELPLQRLTALVTGGTRGIGKAIVHQLAALGAAVSFCGRDEEKLKNAEAEVQAGAGKVRAVQHVTSEDPQPTCEAAEHLVGDEAWRRVRVHGEARARARALELQG